MFNELDKDRKMYFDDLTSDFIAYPIDIFYEMKSRAIVGYTMKYLTGNFLLDGFNDEVDLKKLKEAYLKTRLAILKEKNICMEDLCLENILYDEDNNQMNLIDTSRWYLKHGAQIQNVGNFNWQMMCALLQSIKAESSRLKENKKLGELLEMYQAHEEEVSMFWDFLNELETDISESNGEKVKTIGDLRYKK